MAVNKNFVVKNGLEVNSDLIIADATNKRVGIGSTIPDYTLEVVGGIGATNIYSAGITTIQNQLRVGTAGTVLSVTLDAGRVGVGTTNPAYLLDVRTSTGATTGTTVLYVQGDAAITGNLDVAGDIEYDQVTGRDLYITGLSTFVGFSTHESGVGFRSDIAVAGLSTFVGVATFRDDVYVDGNLNVTGDITYDEVVGRNLNITGIATIATLYAAAGIVTASDVHVSSATTTKDLNVTGVTTTKDLNVTGVATIATLGVSVATTSKDLLVTGVSTFTGIGTFSSDVYIDGTATVLGDLNVTGDISYDEVSGRNIKISGLSTFEGLSYFGSNVGVGTTNPAIAADSNNTNILNAGIVTANYIYGDISGATGVTTAITASIGVSSEGTFVGSAATIINFASSNTTAWNIENSGGGIATATITPGASLGMVIALGG